MTDYRGIVPPEEQDADFFAYEPLPSDTKGDDKMLHTTFNVDQDGFVEGHRIKRGKPEDLVPDDSRLERAFRAYLENDTTNHAGRDAALKVLDGD